MIRSGNSPPAYFGPSSQPQGDGGATQPNPSREVAISAGLFVAMAVAALARNAATQFLPVLTTTSNAFTVGASFIIDIGFVAAVAVRGIFDSGPDPVRDRGLGVRIVLVP